MKKIFILFAAVLMTGSMMAKLVVVATPSVTEFNSLDDLNGMTITFTGTTLELMVKPEPNVFLVDKNFTQLYGKAEYTFADNVMTIPVMGPAFPLPEGEMDMEIYIDNVFSNVSVVESETIHYNPTTTALENTAADVKAIKTIENGKVVIRRGDKKYNVIGAEL